MSAEILLARDGETVAEGELRYVFVESGGGATASIPEPIRTGLARYQVADRLLAPAYGLGSLTAAENMSVLPKVDGQSVGGRRWISGGSVDDRLAERVDRRADLRVPRVVEHRHRPRVGRGDRVVVAEELVDQRVRARRPRVADRSSIERRQPAQRRPGDVRMPGDAREPPRIVVSSRNGSRNPS